MNIHLSKELEDRLINWKGWVLYQNGFPTKSVVADFGLFCGGKSTPMSKPPIPLNNLLAEEMNTWINIMGSGHPEYKYAIKAYYLEPGTIKEKAADCNIAERTFKQRLQFARHWLEGRLSIDIKFLPNRQNSVAECRPDM